MKRLERNVLPKTVKINLKDLLQLLNYYQVASKSAEIGDLGVKTYDDVLTEISQQCEIRVTPNQLESMIYHMKQVVIEKLKPIHTDYRIKNYQKIMKSLSNEADLLFKTLPSGEIVMIDFQG